MESKQPYIQTIDYLWFYAIQEDIFMFMNKDIP